MNSNERRRTCSFFSVSARGTTTIPTVLSTTEAEHGTTLIESAEMVSTEGQNADKNSLEEEEDSNISAVRKRSRMIWPLREITLEDAQTQGLREETIMELEQQAKKHSKMNPQLDALWLKRLYKLFMLSLVAIELYELQLNLWIKAAYRSGRVAGLPNTSTLATATLLVFLFRNLVT